MASVLITGASKAIGRATARPRFGAYAATKWALEALVEALVIEAGPTSRSHRPRAE